MNIFEYYVPISFLGTWNTTDNGFFSHKVYILVHIREKGDKKDNNNIQNS